MNSPLKILQYYWKHNSFRKPQEEIIEAVLAKKNVVALLPTGGGKSICFQIPALLLNGVCIVISPLIALMQDQVNGLQNRGIKALTIPSGSSQDDIIALFDNLKFGNYKFLYLSPERLQSRFIQEKIKELHVSLIAVDEAHCISEWGHDFRPSYRNINTLCKLQPEATVIALTASATKKVVEDITKNLELENPTFFRKSFYRSNLAYQVFEVEDKLYRLQQIFTKTKSPAIVYVNARKKTEQISNYLNSNGFKSSFYHGGLLPSEKKTAFDNWMNEQTPIMVATNAFGMGIDKANVGIVIHFDIPSSIENYQQEAGRAGRNQEKAFAVLLQNKSDVLLFKELNTTSLPTLIEVKEVHKKLYQHFQIAKGELIDDSFDFNFLTFCKKYNFIPTKTSTILKVLINNGIIELTQNFQKKSTIQFTVTSKQVLQHKPYQNFIQILLRSYGGLFEQETTINEFSLAKKTGITSEKAIYILQQLEKDKLLVYNKTSSDAEIRFLQPREDDKTINRNTKEVEQFIYQKKKKATDIINFIEDNTICRNIQLLTYFDEKLPEKCGICDVCLADKKSNPHNVSDKIIALLKKETALSSKKICLQLELNEEDILVHLRTLLSEEKISLNAQNKFYIL